MEWHCRRPPSKINTQEVALKLHNKQASKGFKHKPIFNIKPYVYDAPLPLFVYFKFKHLYFLIFFEYRCHAATLPLAFPQTDGSDHSEWHQHEPASAHRLAAGIVIESFGSKVFCLSEIFFFLQKRKIELLSSNPMCRFAPLEKCRKASCLFIFVHAAESLIFILTQRHHRHLFGLKVSRPHCWSKKKENN